MLCLVEQTALKSAKACHLKAVIVANASQTRRHLSTKAIQKKNHYHVLQLSESATPAEVRAAFVKLSKELHPDKNPEDPDLHDKFVALNEAYTVLSKPYSRQEYDRGLTQQEYRRSYTAQETSWKMQEVEHHYRNDPAFRAYYEGPGADGYRKFKYNNAAFAAVSTTAILGLGTLYLWFGYVYTSKKLEERRQQSVENFKILREVRERARGRSHDEVLTSMVKERSFKLEPAESVKEKGTVS